MREIENRIQSICSLIPLPYELLEIICKKEWNLKYAELGSEEDEMYDSFVNYLKDDFKIIINDINKYNINFDECPRFIYEDEKQKIDVLIKKEDDVYEEAREHLEDYYTDEISHLSPFLQSHFDMEGAINMAIETDGTSSILNLEELYYCNDYECYIYEYV